MSLETVLGLSAGRRCFSVGLPVRLGFGLSILLRQVHGWLGKCDGCQSLLKELLRQVAEFRNPGLKT